MCRSFFGRKIAEGDFVGAVDLVNPEAEYRAVEDVSLSSFDAALVCTPDEPKVEVLTYLLRNGKHVLVEKPLWAKDDQAFFNLETLARKNRVVCYTAYNHRFEPHFIRMRDVISSGELGALYHLLPIGVFRRGHAFPIQF